MPAGYCLLFMDPALMVMPNAAAAGSAQHRQKALTGLSSSPVGQLRSSPPNGRPDGWREMPSTAISGLRAAIATLESAWGAAPTPTL